MDEIDTHGEGLSDWDVGFIGDMVDRVAEGRPFTPGQAKKIEQIHGDRVP